MSREREREMQRGAEGPELDWVYELNLQIRTVPVPLKTSAAPLSGHEHIKLPVLITDQRLL